MWPLNVGAAGASLAYKGDWVAGTYVDGDVVVKDGLVFMAVGGPTTDAPDAAPWGLSTPPVAPAMVKLDEKVVGATSGAALDFVVPAGYRHLKFYGSVKPSGTIGQYRMQLGTAGVADAGANYRYTDIAIAATPPAASQVAATYWDIAYGSTGGGVPAAFDLTIYDYLDTLLMTVMTGIVRQAKQDTTLGEGALKLIEGLYLPTAAVNFARFFPSAGTLDAGSRISMYGVT
jgi:hypothetical protein